MSEFGSALISSVRIAELLGRVHRDVLRDIRNMKEVEGEWFESEYISLQNKKTPCMEMSWECAAIVISKCSKNGRREVIRFAGEMAIQKAINSMDVDESVDAELFVYAMRDEISGNIKIGVSKNPSLRLKQLQTGCPGRLSIVACRRSVGGFCEELEIHKMNAKIGIRGEWFGPAATLEGPSGRAEQ